MERRERGDTDGCEGPWRWAATVQWNKVVHVPLPSAIAFGLVGKHLVLTIGMGETAYGHSSFSTKNLCSLS